MAFENGIAVFFRALLPDRTLARSVHPGGREIEIRSMIAHADDYVILDLDREVLGIYPREWVACIMPLEAGPPNVTN